MKRYLRFVYGNHYTLGDVNELCEEFNTLKQCKEGLPALKSTSQIKKSFFGEQIQLTEFEFNGRYCDFCHVLDIRTGKVWHYNGQEFVIT